MAARPPGVKDVSTHLRSVFIEHGSTSDGAPHFPNHAPSPETLSLLDAYLVGIPAEDPPASGNHHQQHDEAREKEARTLRDALLDCWNAITPWRRVPKAGKEVQSKAPPPTGSPRAEDDSAISAFLTVLSTLYTADPSPLPPSDIAKVWWQWCLRPLIDPRTAPKLPERARQASADAHPQKGFAFAGAARRGRSTSLSRTTAAPPITTPPIPSPASSFTHPPSPKASTSAAVAPAPKRSSASPVRLSRSASAALTTLLVKGATAPGEPGTSVVSALWEGFVSVDFKESGSMGRGRKPRGAEVFESSIVRWAKVRPKAFFEKVSQSIGAAGKVDGGRKGSNRTTETLAALTLLTSFVRSFPQMSHHMLSTSLIPSLIWIVVAPWSGSPSPPTSRLPALGEALAPAVGGTEEKEKDAEGEKAVATLVIGALAMILPRIPTSVEPYLNSIFVAFARAACWEPEEDDTAFDPLKPPVEAPSAIAHWDNEDFVGPYGIAIERTPSGPGAPPAPAGASSHPSRTASRAASRTASPSRAHTDPAVPPRRAPPLLPSDAKRHDDSDGLPFLTSATELFTVLYGLFPCNFVEFLRDPRAYLEAQGWTGRLLMDPLRLRLAVLVSEAGGCPRP